LHEDVLAIDRDHWHILTLFDSRPDEHLLEPNDSRIRVPHGVAKARVVTYVTWDTNATGHTRTYVACGGGATIFPVHTYAGVSTNGNQTGFMTEWFNGKAGDDIDLRVSQDGGSRAAIAVGSPPERLPEHRQQFGHLLALLAPVAGADRVVDAMLDVVLQDLVLDPLQGRAHRLELLDDIDAVAVVLNHTGNAADLAFDAVEAREAAFVGGLLHSGRILPEGT